MTDLIPLQSLLRKKQVKSPDFEFSADALEVTPERLIPLLMCLGVKIDAATADDIAERQNPFKQTRAGLGKGIYAIIDIPSAEVSMGSSSKSRFVNINASSAQADISPLGIILDKDGDGFTMTLGEAPYTRGKLYCCSESSKLPIDFEWRCTTLPGRRKYFQNFKRYKFHKIRYGRSTFGSGNSSFQPKYYRKYDKAEADKR